jgi:hypothetical protein
MYITLMGDSVSHMGYNAGESGVTWDKGKEHKDYVDCLVGGAKVDQKVTPLCVICRFFIDIEKDKS